MQKFMDLALEEAKKSLKTNDVPVGAIIVEKDKIISKAHNTREKKNKITGHAEINAVEKACKKKNSWHLDDCELYVTLEPCKMCLEVIKQVRIKKIFYAYKQQKKDTLKNPELIHLEQYEKNNKILKEFFKNLRKK